MKKIYITLLGGLGNQLYQIAFGYMLMHNLSRRVYFDKSKFLKYKDHKLVVDKLFPDLKFVQLNRSLFLNRIFESGVWFDEFLVQRIKNKSRFNNLIVNGYFQSLSYFSFYLPVLRSLLLERIENLYPELKNKDLKNRLKNYLGIHIRRGNKTNILNSKMYGLRSIDETLKNINYVYSRGKYSSIILFGDDLNYLNDLKTKIKIKTNIYLSNDIISINDELIDFYLLTFVKDLMITNSTFSLWAGYLREKGNVFYPKPFYPYPLHKSVLNHNIEDVILPSWLSYKIDF